MLIHKNEDLIIIIMIIIIMYIYYSLINPLSAQSGSFKHNPAHFTNLFLIT